MEDTPLGQPNLPGQPAPKFRADTNPDQPAKSRHGRRLQRIREEVERNRTEGPAVPTWVLVLILVLIVGAVTTVVMFS